LEFFGFSGQAQKQEAVKPPFFTENGKKAGNEECRETAFHLNLTEKMQILRRNRRHE